MQIDFFEEFPTKQNLDKLKLLKFKTNLHVAATSLKSFFRLRNQIKKKYKKVQEIGYWPVLKKDEGYWLSAFSKRKALKRIIGELEKNKSELTLMWDAELPLLKTSLFLTEFPNFLFNRMTIQNFLENAQEHNINIAIAKYPIESRLFHLAANFLGVSFPSRVNHKAIAMAYTSFANNNVVERFLESQIKKGRKNNGKNFTLGIGVIAKGMADERLLKPEELYRDLKTTQGNNIENVVIYRLGGLNKEYLRVMEFFV